MSLFHYLNVSPESSVEDQFAGNVTFESLFHRLFPDHQIPEDIHLAMIKVLKVLEHQTDIKQILHGINLWKLPLDKQAALVLYRLQKHASNLTHDTDEAITLLLEGLDTDLEELTAEDIDESYTAEKLFDEMFGNLKLPADVQEARGIVTYLLLPAVKEVYRGIDFSSIVSPRERLVAVLQAMHQKNDLFPAKLTPALQVLSRFLKLQLETRQIDPYTFDLAGHFDKVIPSSAPQTAQQAKTILLSSVNRWISIFKKILHSVNSEGYVRDEDLVLRILNAISDYRNETLPAGLQVAGEYLSRFLRRQPVDTELVQRVTKHYHEEDEVDVRMFDDNITTKGKKHWKRKKSK